MWRVRGVSGRSARTIRNFCLEVSQDLVLQDIRKSTFQHLTVNLNFNVLEMAFKTIRFVQGLPRTPLLFLLRNFKTIPQNWKSENLGNLKNPETHFSRFTNRCLGLKKTKKKTRPKSWSPSVWNLPAEHPVGSPEGTPPILRTAAAGP